MKILVIAPHADDEVLGCGGTIARHAESLDNVTLCIVCDFYNVTKTQRNRRMKEMHAVADILGIEKIVRLNLPNAYLDVVAQKELNDGIHRVVVKYAPDIVYVPYGGDLHRDHRVVFEASMVALRPNKDHVVQKIYAYEVPSETEWLPSSRAFTPNTYVNIYRTLNLKLKAMECYKSEVREHPHPRSCECLTALAKKRGAEAYLDVAEAFILLRGIVK